MGKELLGLVFFGILFVFGIFTYIPFSDNVSLTNNPNGVLETYFVDSNWGDRGTLDGLVTDGDILYAEANQIGNWTGAVQSEENSEQIKLEASGDPRDGKIVIYINSWQDLPNGDAPDNVYQTTLSDFSINQSFMAEQYNYFNVVVEIEETSGSNNQRPNLDSLSVDFLNKSEQFGFRNDDFQIFTLFVLLGSGLMALLRWV